jgi:hypothetical protein
MPDSAPIRLAVITGQHNFDVPGFHRLLRALPDCEFYIQDLDNFAAADEATRDGYDALLFYNFHRQMPPEDTDAGKRLRAALERPAETGQGLLALHHGLLCFPEWDLWTRVTGLADRGFGWYPEQQVAVHVADADHPITRGLADWTLTDETYTMVEPADGSRVLLSTEHPHSLSSLGWVREYGRAPVFCLALGHDALAWDDATFRTVLSRSLTWLAGRA